ncbi:MAG: hypothetical protein ACI8RD_009749, partial [Bacillariaceae sp.]
CMDFKRAQRDKSLMRGLRIQAHVLIRELYIVRTLLISCPSFESFIYFVDQ